MRYIAVDRDDLRPLLFDDAALADLLLNTFIRRREILQEREVGLEIIGPHSSERHPSPDRVRAPRPPSSRVAGPRTKR